MEKLKMQTANVVDENIKRIGELFPNCLTERLDENGRPEVAIDFDQLRQELSKDIVEGPEERYQFTWPDKRNAIRLANAPTTDTLRPCREESVDFDNTQNLYIEGDNLEVLKLLRENYLGKVKMIYIDPPYNTGNDFVYNDDFAQTRGNYIHNSGQEDEEGNRLVANTESNGRFHTDWLNMMYPRLKVAKDLLREDGVVFISIDDNEVDNLKKICDEIFGPFNFVADISWQRTYAPRNDSKGISAEKEHIIVYSKHPEWTPYKLPRTVEMDAKYGSIDGDENKWRADNPCAPGGASHQGMVYAIQNPFTGNYIYPTNDAHWRYQQKDMLQIMKGWAKYKLENLHDEERRSQVCGISKDAVRRDVLAIVIDGSLEEAKKNAKVILERGKWPMYYFTRNGEGGIAKKTYLNPDNGKVVTNLWLQSEVGNTDEAKKELLSLFEGKAPFDTPKPTRLLNRILEVSVKEEGIVLDFFSGSATTAHAVLSYNANNNANIKFVLVQLSEKSNNPKYPNICEIGKERIRRAGKQILGNMESRCNSLQKNIDMMLSAKPDATAQMLLLDQLKEIAENIYKEKILPKQKELDELRERMERLDTGFRVLKLDSSNMQDVYYSPEEFNENLLFEDNIKLDRTDEDLLFQVMIELGIELSAKIECLEYSRETLDFSDETAEGKGLTSNASKLKPTIKVWNVAEGYLMACFDNDVNETAIKAIAKQHPYYFVLRDASLATDQVADNFEQIWEEYSKDTIRRII